MNIGQILLNLSPMMIEELQFTNPAEAALITNGFELFALHRMLTARGENAYHQLVNNLLPKAKTEIQNNGTALLPVFRAITGMLNQQCTVLEGYGADLADPDSKPAAKLVDKMAALGIQAELVPELCKFYCYAKKWNTV